MVHSKSASLTFPFFWDFSPHKVILLQDIVTASPQFNVDAFIPQLREFLTVQDLKQCMFLIRWIALLASVPDVDMLSHLPQVLGGLLDAMTTDFRDVTDAAGRALEVISSFSFYH